MADSVIIAIITAVATVIAQWISTAPKRKADEQARIDKETEQHIFQAELKSEMEEVKKKLDIHNGYAEKLGDIKTDIAVIKNEIKNIKSGGGN